MTSLILEAKVTSYEVVILGDDIFRKLECIESYQLFYKTLV